MGSKSPNVPGPPPGTTQVIKQQAPQVEGEKEGVKTHNGPRTATVNLPFVTAEFRAPQLHMPHMPHVPTPHVAKDEVVAAAQTARSYLPEPRQALYFGGLALLAAIEVLEWPVAAAIGVGTAIASRVREGRQQSGTKPAEGAEANPEASSSA
jgi:hypothetical protein